MKLAGQTIVGIVFNTSLIMLLLNVIKIIKTYIAKGISFWNVEVALL